jgi:hypothetical protein
MPGTFAGRMEALIDMIGRGEIVGKVEFDQVYAHRQHEELAWKHPRGGQAQYLTEPLYELMPGMMERMADHALQPGGMWLGMVANMELLAQEASRRAPVEVGTLRGSDHPTVTENGVTTYDRPPVVPRLDDATLDAIHDMVSDIGHPDVGQPRKRKG